MIVRAFNVTIATASMPNSVSQAIHSDVENMKLDVLATKRRKLIT